jgi:hypothetical protein
MTSRSRTSSKNPSNVSATGSPADLPAVHARKAMYSSRGAICSTWADTLKWRSNATVFLIEAMSTT